MRPQKSWHQGEFNFVEVDWTEQWLCADKAHRRRRRHQFGNAFVGFLLPFGRDAKPLLESQLHHRFKSMRQQGEWFALEPALLDFIESAREQNVSGMPNDLNGIRLTS